MMEVYVHRIVLRLVLLLLRSLTLPATLLWSHWEVWGCVHIELILFFGINILSLFSFRHLIRWLRQSILSDRWLLKGLSHIRLTQNMNLGSSWNCWARIRINRSNSIFRTPSILNHLLNFLLLRDIYIVLFRYLHHAIISFLGRKSRSLRCSSLHLNLISLETIMGVHWIKQRIARRITGIFISSW